VAASDAAACTGRRLLLGPRTPQPVTDFPTELKREGIARTNHGTRTRTVILGDSGRYAVMD
jgi:hypothetical protein